MNKFIPRLTKMSLGIVAWAFCYSSFGQHSLNTTIYNSLFEIEKDTVLSFEQKLPKLFALKKQFEHSKLGNDSVYARILHRIGLFDYRVNHDIATKNAILYTNMAIRINSSGKKNTAPALCINGYTNLGNFYKSLYLYNVALRYYDSALIWRKRYFIPNISAVMLILIKADMLYKTGDYQKAIEELNFAIVDAKAAQDSAILPAMLVQRAQSHIMQRELDKAMKDATEAGNISSVFDNSHEMINSMLLKAEILAKQKEFSKALLLYNQGISKRLRIGDYDQVSDDYTDMGNVYMLGMQEYTLAKQCYLNTIKYALKTGNAEKLSKGHINLEQCSFRQNNYKAAEQFYIEALKDLKVTSNQNIFHNPPASRFMEVGNKELVLVILNNKTELLLTQFLQTRNKNYLHACLQTALLTDTILTRMRHEQMGEQSKLYWRDRTREFFTNALDACYLANDPALAFFFMEKSRAVLLNDKLNELGASMQLSATEAVKEQEFKIAVSKEQQNLSLLNTDDKGFEAQQAKLSAVKEQLEHYIRSIENKYPAYYQYKYADEVPSLSSLQSHLLLNKQSFIHYFMNDTVAYILGIAPHTTKLVKLSKKVFSARQLVSFLERCGNEPTLDSEYTSFTRLSNSLYKLLFLPLEISKGRVVICPDNFAIPFEALCSDSTGNTFLINDFIFSYVYSARYLLKKYNTFSPVGDFAGFAPVSFQSYAHIADLKHSGEALKKSAHYYNTSMLLTGNGASRQNFISAVSAYTVSNVFSHASADTTGSEPRLYMFDSVIYLSELQLLHKPATKLVVLSACETNVGKNAKGEGVFSLARGFASAGISSVAATLWKADEQTTYTILERFHAYLSGGMPKDEALQKAKLDFIQNGDHAKPFPYYWANMILVGNPEPISFSQNHVTRWWAAAFMLIVAVVVFTVRRLKKRKE